MRFNSLQAALDDAAETRAIAAECDALNVRARIAPLAARRFASLAALVSRTFALTAPIMCRPWTLERRQYRAA